MEQMPRGGKDPLQLARRGCARSSVALLVWNPLLVGVERTALRGLGGYSSLVLQGTISLEDLLHMV